MVLGFGNNFNMLGMGGCYGNGGMFNLLGGGNMFGGMLGGGCSIFGGGAGYYGMSGCDMSVGYAVGANVANVGCMALSKAMYDKQANSSQVSETNVKTLQSQIDTKLSNIGASESDYKNKKASSSDIEVVEYSLNTAKDKLPALESGLKILQSELVELEASKASETDATQKSLIETKIANKKTEIATKKAEIKAANDSVEALEKKLLEAKKAQEKEQANIDKTIAEISKLIEERNKIQAQLNDKLLDKADGSHWQQSKKDRFENKYTGFGTEDETLIDNRITREDIRYIIQNYRDAQTPEAKEKWRARFEQAYGELETKDRTSSFKEAAKIILG